MSRSLNFPQTLLAVIVGTLFFVANVAFISIPWSLGKHPGEAPVTTITTHNFHPT